MGVQLEIAANPSETMYVTDNAEGLDKAKAAGMIPILLMHNPDEAMRVVTANKPEGAIVSLSELPDFLRLVVHAAPAAFPSTPLLLHPLNLLPGHHLQTLRLSFERHPMILIDLIPITHKRPWIPDQLPPN